MLCYCCTAKYAFFFIFFSTVVSQIGVPGKSKCLTGCLGLVHWDDPEGWYGEGGGRRVQDGEHIMVSVWLSQRGITGLDKGSSQGSWESN